MGAGVSAVDVTLAGARVHSALDSPYGGAILAGGRTAGSLEGFQRRKSYVGSVDGQP